MAFAESHRRVQLTVFVDHAGEIMLKLSHPEHPSGHPDAAQNHEATVFFTGHAADEKEEKAIIAQAMKAFYDSVKQGRIS